MGVCYRPVLGMLGGEEGGIPKYNILEQRHGKRSVIACANSKLSDEPGHSLL